MSNAKNKVRGVSFLALRRMLDAVRPVQDIRMTLVGMNGRYRQC